MRALPAVLLLFAAFAVPPAAAQDECSAADPCLLVVEVGPTGFVDVNEWNRSQGDVLTFEVDNSDDASHTVTLSGYDVTVTVPALSLKEVTLALTKAGTFTMTDSPSGDTGTLTVVAGDAVAYEQGQVDASGNPVSSSGMPGPALPFLVIAIAAMALARRR